MKNDNIAIMRRNSRFLLFGLIFLFCLLCGIFLFSLRFLPFGPKSDPFQTVFLIGGIALAVIGLTGYIIFLVSGVRKKEALVITNKGFTNLLIGGKDGVYVEWISVKSLKIYGMRKSPILGLSLVDDDSYIAQLSGKDRKEAEYNRSVGLSVINIPQSSVRSSVDELKNLFSRMIKGAISWENYSRQEQKREPVRKAEDTPETNADTHRVSKPAKPEFKSFAQRREEAEALSKVQEERRKEGVNENQTVMFPGTGEYRPYEHTEQSKEKKAERMLFGETGEEEDGFLSADESATPASVPSEEDSSELPSDIPPAGTAPAETTAAAENEGDGSEDDDEILSLEDEDEDPVPVEDAPKGNPFSSFEKPGSKDAVTILNIDDEEE